jgi:hypothetical protein
LLSLGKFGRSRMLGYFNIMPCDKCCHWQCKSGGRNLVYGKLFRASCSTWKMVQIRKSTARHRGW